MTAGASTAWSGSVQPTLGGWGLSGLTGMSPEGAEFVYGMAGLTPVFFEAYALNKAVSTEIAYSQLSRASYQGFIPGGLRATDEVMATPQAQALVQEIKIGSPGISDELAKRYAAEYIQSGSSLPHYGTALSGSVLIKVVPKGDQVSNYTGFWMDPQQARAIATMTQEQAGKVLGLPASQAAKIQSSGMDFYAISPRVGTKPNIFVSEVAKTGQGAIAMPSGAQQVLVPNRSQWTDPAKVNPFSL